MHYQVQVKSNYDNWTKGQYEQMMVWSELRITFTNINIITHKLMNEEMGADTELSHMLNYTHLQALIILKTLLSFPTLFNFILISY